jgi:hypothetical protein
VLALLAALTILLVLPLQGGATTRPLPGAVNSVLNVAKRVTTKVTASAKHVVAPVEAAATSIARPTGSAGAAVAAAPVRAGSAARATGLATSSGGTTPPMYGTNPHGQGTVASLFLNPSGTVPYPYKPGGSGGQILVVGNGRSEQQTDGTYDAHTTIAALLGSEILGVNATQGQSNTGPLNAVQTGVLDKLCMATSNAVCLQVLAADTAATTTGASTHFMVLGAKVLGANGLNTGVASSDSSITTSGGCETATGASQAANIMLAGGQVASAGKSSTMSKACNDGSAPVQQDSSSVIGLGGVGVGIPAAGCANGTPNTKTGLAPLLTIICNADDTTQLATPAGVREALTVLALQTANSALVKTTVVAAESHAVAPSTSPSNCTDSDHDCGNGPPLISPSGAKCKGYPADTVDNDGDCDAGYQKSGLKGNQHHHHGGQKCTDSDHDCGKGPAGTGKCSNDVSDHDGDCVLPGGGSETSPCPDSDHDCGRGPAGTGSCTNDTVDNDGDCVLPGGGSETVGATAKVKSANLPFTGDNVLEVILVGLVLGGAGLGIASRTRRRSQ